MESKRLSEPLAEGKPAPVERISRGEKLVNDNAPIPLPYLDSTYVTDLLFELGPVSFGSMGAAPLDDGHLRNWMSNNGVELPPWVTRMVKRLSRDYLAASHSAEKPDCPSPWEQESQDDRRERIAAQVRSAMRSLK